ncbi:hypothetical protein [Novimethylophilus sp.]|uniref:hypothetical protein n=1 Tax=Novimethylophilus sp. TaxID=2137426 RepID=UPI002F3EDB53
MPKPVFPLLILCLLPAIAVADAAPPAPGAEENIRALDADHDGLVTVTEMRAFLEARHGKDYEKTLLDEMEEKAGTKSCGSPFSRSFY